MITYQPFYKSFIDGFSLINHLEFLVQPLCHVAERQEKDPDGGPFPAYPSGKTWDEASGKTGSGKKFFHNIIDPLPIKSVYRTVTNT